MANEQKIPDSVNRFQRFGIVVGLAGLLAGGIGAATGSLDRFFQSYLFAFLFWLGISVGSLAFLMIHHLTGSRWGLTLRRVNEAASGTIWLMGLLFIPLLFNLPGLYLWARPEAVAESEILQFRSAYLNIPFFITRAVIYFAIWVLLAYLLNRLSSRWAETGDQKYINRLRGWGAFGLILYTLTMTFAAIDWNLSIEPFWSSSAYGLIVIVGQLLTSLAFGIVILNLIPNLGLGRPWTLKTTPIPYKDLGALLLTFVMSWAYLAYFQLLIIWSGNIPREVTWYIHRTEGGWMPVGVAVVILQVALPFIALLSIRARHNMRILGVLGVVISIVYLINSYWQVIPAFHPGEFSFHWLDLALPIGIGGLWIAGFLAALKKRPVLRESEERALEPQTGHEHLIT
jgi:hypothetical protein